MHRKTHLLINGLMVLALCSGSGWAQRITDSSLQDLSTRRVVTMRSFASNVIVPQQRVFSATTGPRSDTSMQMPVTITAVEVNVKIMEQVATTSMDISLRNNSSAIQEAELLTPVPPGALVRSFAFEGPAKEPTAKILTKEEARRTYDQIVARSKDPALLEFLDYNLVRSSVFPVPAGGTQKVRLVYENVLPADGERVDYVLPRSEALDYQIPWKISVSILTEKPISTIYSPTHQLQTDRLSAKSIKTKITEQSRLEPGPFQLSYLLEKNGVTASLLAYPDATIGGGYFLLLAGLPAKALKTGEGPAIKREVTLVIDRSGSMNGEKLEQAREAALQILAGLEKGEAFNIITYNDGVDFFAEAPVLNTEKNVELARSYLKSITSRGGTNIHDALLEALRQKPREDYLPLVMFLTDGLPTVGQTSEVAIREVAIKANPYKRRTFTFGVGVDVNAPLLERIAAETRATSTFVLPQEDVEVKVGQVFKRLSGPVLAEPELTVVDQRGGPAPARTRDIIPRRLPDMFEGDQLVLLGQYVGDEPLQFNLNGNYLGRPRNFKFEFKLDTATTRNSFVPRLWASRKIGELTDAIRQLGASDSAIANVQLARNPAGDPRVKELVDEIIRLSTEFGILTEYTSFLALEGTDLGAFAANGEVAYGLYKDRGQNTRSGMGGVNQSLNNKFYFGQSSMNRGNWFLDANMDRVSISNVQQVNDLAFYNRNGRWIDSRLAEQSKDIKPDREIKIGSPEHLELARRLTKTGRNGAVSLRGEILIQVDGKSFLLK